MTEEIAAACVVGLCLIGARPHEEESLKGPGVAAGPADYWTIIRYTYKKR
jgi:hypothetical protein